jgi:hypothetical protein
LKGRLSYQWGEIQDAYFKWLGKRNTGRTWVIALMKKLWNIMWDMWDNRNDVKHNAISAVHQRKIDVLNSQIREQFRMGSTNLSSRDYHWTNRNINEVFNYSLDIKEKWVRSVTLARENIAERLANNNAAAQQRKNFAQWFVPRT